MARRHSPQAKARAKELLAANSGDIILVHSLTGIAERTLYKWRREKPVEPPLPKLRRPLPEGDTFVVLRQQLTKHAAALVQSLADDMDEATLSQRATALNQVMLTIIRLSTLVPPDNHDSEVLRIEYKDADGTTHASPPWARNDPAVESALQSGGVWSPFWQDGDGEDSAG